jgi:glycosyltransferase involved in cell wall biosynthesis
LKILLLTQVLPYPPDSGPKVKTWNVIKYLSLHHDVTLVSFVRGDQQHDIEVLKKYCREVHTVEMDRSIIKDGMALVRSMVTGLPWLIARDRRSAMVTLIRSITTEQAFDVVHADQLNMAQYAAAVERGIKVIDEHNALWLLYRRMAGTMPSGPRKWLLNRDWRLLRTYEGQICRDFDSVLTVSEVDRDALMEVAGEKLNFTVIPIAVDTDEVAPVERAVDANRIVHIGTMFWPPNVDGILWFTREVLPIIRAVKPEVGFDIIGAKPPQEILYLGEVDPLINVTGYVEDTTPYQEKTGVLIVPVRAGGGMRVKILNALSQALPMVTTTIGCEGIAVEHGKHLLIADTPQEFAEAVIRLLDDRDAGQRLAQNGRLLIQEQYDYRKVCAALEPAYHNNKQRLI